MASRLNIAIVGGGPGGLTLACILNHLLTTSRFSSKDLSFKVFELDASKNARSQGGMLDIHRMTGQQAIKRAGLIEEFKKNMRIDATEVYIRDSAGAVHFHHSEEQTGGYGQEGDVPDVERPEIDRRALRAMLINGLPEESIAWGKKLASISSTKSTDNASIGPHKFELHFADGTSAGGFDLVVGADGAWSKVRAGTEALGGADVAKSNPPYSGIICIDALISDAAKRYPHLTNWVGKGSCFAVGKKDGVFSQLNGDGSLRSYIFFDADADWKIEGDPAAQNGRRAVSKQLLVEKCLADWCQETKELILQHDGDAIPVRALYEFPPGHSWKSPVEGITLLGDAAHVMTPFAGVGVNLALHDALDLSVEIEKILQGSSSISDALNQYETEMYKRASTNVEETFRNREVCLGKRGPGNTSLGNEGIDKVVQIFTGLTGGGVTEPESA